MDSKALKFETLKRFENYFRSVDGNSLEMYNYGSSSVDWIEPNYPDNWYNIPFITIRGVIID